MNDQNVEFEELARLRRDAARYRWLRSKVRGTRSLGSSRPAVFAFPGAADELPPLGDIMRGGVAQHLDAAIDAAMSPHPAPVSADD